MNLSLLAQTVTSQDGIFELTTSDMIIHAILSIGFLVAALGLLHYAIRGRKTARWLRFLGFAMATSFAIAYGLLAFASAGQFTNIRFTSYFIQFGNTLTLGLLLMWVFATRYFRDPE